MSDSIKFAGWVEVIVRDKNGKVKYYMGPRPIEEVIREFEGKGGNNGDCSFTVQPLADLPAKFQDFYWRKNIITNVGLAAMIRLIFSGLTETKFGYLAIGTGTTAESASDTALQTEIKRKTATITQVTTSITGDTALCEATFSSADGLSGTATVSEAGIFNASTGGILLARKTFSGVPLNWDAGDQITIRYYVQAGR
jgi:hypothetical protein